jgi:hypothetical protein
MEFSQAAHAILKRIRRAKRCVCLRQHRHELLCAAFQQALAPLPQGQPPVPPAPLALATLVPAYTQVSDDEVIEATILERRWHLVLEWTGPPPRCRRQRCASASMSWRGVQTGSRRLALRLKPPPRSRPLWRSPSRYVRKP